MMAAAMNGPRAIDDPCDRAKKMLRSLRRVPVDRLLPFAAPGFFSVLCISMISLRAAGCLPIFLRQSF